MTSHLLAVTVGPVQDFIAAARRTRDLWFGSYLLSEVSKAAAKAVRDNGGDLIFPAPPNDDALAADSPFNVANVIVAELRDSEPASVAAVAREAARSRWRSFADRVFSTHRDVIRPEIWSDQVDDVLELHAAWVRCSTGAYRTDRETLMRLLAARKRCRDFQPARGRAGIPKSSLDGLRESVLRPPSEWPERARRRLRVEPGEQLDVVAMVKRAWAGDAASARYPSVARIAADPWLRGVGADGLAQVRAACIALGPEVIHAVDLSPERGQPGHAVFPFEGTAVYRSRHQDIREEVDLTLAEIGPLTASVERVTKDFGEPSPYLAVLMADGDGMGNALGKLTSSKEHQDFSRALATFAGEARKIVQRNQGTLVYAGGDDVLAFLPVDTCVRCARELREGFSRALGSTATSKATLSVGVAVAHFMEPLEDLLEYGRAAEGHAKRTRPEDEAQPERDALAVHLVKRGGDPVAFRAPWPTAPDQLLTQLAEWTATRAVSGRVAHDLHRIAAAYDTWAADIVPQAIQGDTISILGGKEPGGETKMRDVEGLVRAHVRSADSLRRLGDALLIARQMGLAISQAKGGAAAPEVPQ